MPRATTLRMYMFHQLWHDVHAFSKTSLIYYVKKLCIYSDVQCMFLVFHEVRIKFNGVCKYSLGSLIPCPSPLLCTQITLLFSNKAMQHCFSPKESLGEMEHKKWRGLSNVGNCGKEGKWETQRSGWSPLRLDMFNMLRWVHTVLCQVVVFPTETHRAACNSVCLLTALERSKRTSQYSFLELDQDCW